MSDPKFIKLDYTHSEVNELLKKIQDGMVLSEQEYNKLFKEIGIENISTFDGDYNNLVNLPVIPVNLGDLVNDLEFQDVEDVMLLLEDFKQNTLQKLLDKKVDNEQLELFQDEIENVNLNMNNKANKDELFNKDYNELLNKPEIPSIEGLATEMYVDEKIVDLIDFAPEAMNAINDLAKALEDHEDIFEAFSTIQEDLLEGKVDKKEGFGLADEAEMARLSRVDNYDDAELREALDNKANRDELFDRDYNGLNNLPEIPNIEGLASELFVLNQIDAIPEIDLEPFARKEELFSKDYNELLNKPEIPNVDGLASEDFIYERLAEKANNEHDHDDMYYTKEKIDYAFKEIKNNTELEELRNKIDEQKPYLADVAAYPTSKFLFACGQPMTVEPNTNNKYSAKAPEDAVAFVYRWDNGFECIVLEKDIAAKTYLVGGYGHDNIHAKRPIPQTNMLVRDVKLKGLVGGSYFEGMVGHVTMEAENCEIANIIGGGWCGAAVNGEMTRMNVADDINIKLNNVKGLSLVYGGPQGNGVANKVHMELIDCEAGWVTAGGSNGMTRDAVVVINGGSVKVAQSTNRGIVHKAKFMVIDGVIEKLYFGGETEDSSVNGMIEDNFVELIGGEVKDFCFGTNNGVEMTAEDMKGTVTNCIVSGESVAVLEKIDMPKNPIMGDCVFNEKLNRPIWFNGKNWIDANGCIVG